MEGGEGSCQPVGSVPWSCLLTLPQLEVFCFTEPGPPQEPMLPPPPLPVLLLLLSWGLEDAQPPCTGPLAREVSTQLLLLTAGADLPQLPPPLSPPLSPPLFPPLGLSFHPLFPTFPPSPSHMLLEDPLFLTAGSPQSPVLGPLEPPLLLPQPWELLGPSPQLVGWLFMGPSAHFGDLSSEPQDGVPPLLGPLVGKGSPQLLVVPFGALLSDC